MADRFDRLFDSARELIAELTAAEQYPKRSREGRSAFMSIARLAEYILVLDRQADRSAVNESFRLSTDVVSQLLAVRSSYDRLNYLDLSRPPKEYVALRQRLETELDRLIAANSAPQEPRSTPESPPDSSAEKEERRNRHELRVEIDRDEKFRHAAMLERVSFDAMRDDRADEEREQFFTFYMASLRERGFLPPLEGQPSTEVGVYLDTDDEVLAEGVFSAVEDFMSLLGYGPPESSETRRGSIFKRFRVRAAEGLNSQEMQERLVKAERVLELWQIDSRQAEVDSKEAQAFQAIVTAVKDIDTVCMKLGSILLIKYVDASGQKLFCRNLSQLEIRALEKYPEIQTNPREALDRLAMGVAQLSNDEPQVGWDRQLPG